MKNLKTFPFRAYRLTSVVAALLALTLLSATGDAVRWWTTTENGSSKLAAQPELPLSGGSLAPASITVNPDDALQSIAGLGTSLEHSTCYNLSLLPPQKRQEVLESLLDPQAGIGISMMRICIGTPDFTASSWYTYNDLPVGQTDPELKHFSIARDREYVLPILKAARAINPNLRFIAAPWSPPGWMKTNRHVTGGKVDPRHYPSLARYFGKFLSAYRDEGIEIYSLSIQNEPEYAPETYPTCRWTAREQRDFIRDHLGPLLSAEHPSVKLWCFDHNFNSPGFAATILSDPLAARYVDGTAFHLYEGKPSAMSWLHERFPKKNIYFTEGSTYGVAGAEQIISFFRNWAQSYNAWVTCIDHLGQPNPGPHECDPTMIVLNRATLEVEYRFEYYMYGHFMKFMRPGAVRVGSSNAPGQPANVAFRNLDGSLVVIIANSRSELVDVTVSTGQASFVASLQPRSVSTFLWR